MRHARSLVPGSLHAAAALVLIASTATGSDSRSCPTPSNYCLTSPNSVGPGAVISWRGTPSLQTDDFHLVATGCPPGQLLMFYYGSGQTNVVFGDGWRCVNAGGKGIFRFKALLTDGNGTAVMKLDYTKPPAGTGGGAGRWLPGDTVNCQGWYHDPAAGGAGFNLTDALEVPICLDGPYDGMVLIPAGEFEMGDHYGIGSIDEHPVHLVYLDAFYADVYEVTNQRYAAYLNASYAEGRVKVTFGGDVLQVGGAGKKLCETTTASSGARITWDGVSFGVSAGKEDHPMARVTWYGACTYANHLSRDHGLTPCYDVSYLTWTCDFDADGFRLPTEAEWEYAARGGEHNPYYLYPWGNTVDGSHTNYANSGDPYESGPTPWTTPVGYYDGNQTPPGGDMANGYGLYDMSGNVSEWCWDSFDPSYYSNSPYDNPTGPPTSSWYCVRRGGGWDSIYTTYLRSAKRYGTSTAKLNGHIGFRVGVPRP